MSMPRLVASTDMLGIIPLSLAASFAQVFDLQVSEPPIPLPGIPLNQFWHRRMHNDPAIAWLRGVVADVLAGHLPPPAFNEAGRYGSANLRAAMSLN